MLIGFMKTKCYILHLFMFGLNKHDTIFHFGQNQTGCFPLLSVFMLSKANKVLTPTAYLTGRNEIDIHLHISLS